MNMAMFNNSRLRKLREKRRLSQQEIADALGISQATYSNWESKCTNIKIEYLPKLIAIYELEWSDFFPECIKSKSLHNQIEVLNTDIDENNLYIKLVQNLEENNLLLKAQNHNHENKIKSLKREISRIKKYNKKPS